MCKRNSESCCKADTEANVVATLQAHRRRGAWPTPPAAARPDGPSSRWSAIGLGAGPAQQRSIGGTAALGETARPRMLSLQRSACCFAPLKCSLPCRWIFATVSDRDLKSYISANALTLILYLLTWLGSGSMTTDIGSAAESQFCKAAYHASSSVVRYDRATP